MKDSMLEKHPYLAESTLLRHMAKFLRHAINPLSATLIFNCVYACATSILEKKMRFLENNFMHVCLMLNYNSC